MKEIAKRARRREAKKQQLQEIIQIQKHSIHNHQSFSSTRVSSRVAASFSKNSNINSSSSPSPSSSRALHSHQGHHHGHHNHLGHHLATCVACWADQNNAAKAALVNSSLSAANGNGLVNSSAATTSTPLANVGGATLPPPASGTSVVRTRSAVSRKLDLASSKCSAFYAFLLSIAKNLIIGIFQWLYYLSLAISIFLYSSLGAVIPGGVARAKYVLLLCIVPFPDRLAIGWRLCLLLSSKKFYLVSLSQTSSSRHLFSTLLSVWLRTSHLAFQYATGVDGYSDCWTIF